MDNIYMEDEIEKFIIKYKKFITKDIYITNKMYHTFMQKYKYLYTYVHHNNKNYTFLRDIVIKQRQIVKMHNTNFVNKKLIDYKDYFDNMFKDIDKNILLDKNQRKAIICEEENLLVIAGAGSGKTTTMTAKVKYLIDKCNYKESDIAAGKDGLAFAVFQVKENNCINGLHYYALVNTTNYDFAYTFANKDLKVVNNLRYDEKEDWTIPSRQRISDGDSNRKGLESCCILIARPSTIRKYEFD